MLCLAYVFFIFVAYIFWFFLFFIVNGKLLHFY
jgi:hypothetical protein